MFIARQPIFNKKMEVYGYELLFRSNINANVFSGASSLGATAVVMEQLYESGLDKLVEDKYAFVNFDEDFIHSNALELISSERLIIEVLETVKVDYLLVRRIRELRKKGYKIALDDFNESYSGYPLANVADIIKYDLLHTPLETIETDVKIALAQRKLLLAEKVETKEIYEAAKDMGFHLFQGYFFSKPRIISRSNKRFSSKFQYTSIIRELKKKEPSYQYLAELIGKDVDLSYRLMKVVSKRSKDNSISSIKKALTFLGLKEIERWINVLMLQDLCNSQTTELMKTSLIRSKFAESIALYIDLEESRYEASMMGLFSVLDAMLDMPISQALSEISLPEEIIDALINNEGILAPIYNIILAYENANWIEVEELLKNMDIDEKGLYDSYLVAIGWANDALVLIA